MTTDPESLIKLAWVLLNLIGTYSIVNLEDSIQFNNLTVMDFENITADELMIHLGKVLLFRQKCMPDDNQFTTVLLQATSLHKLYNKVLSDPRLPQSGESVYVVILRSLFHIFYVVGSKEKSAIQSLLKYYFGLTNEEARYIPLKVRT
jgi:hypothetical protein